MSNEDYKYVKRYESHPGKPLYVHTEGTTKRGLAQHDSLIVKLNGLFHDTGKLNFYFGEKLKGKVIEGYSNHSYLSCLTFLYFYKNNNHICSIRDMFIISLCIIKHHGSLTNLFKIVNNEELERLNSFLKEDKYFPVHSFLELIKIGKVDKFDFNKFDTENIKKIFSYKLWNNHVRTKYEKLSFFLDLRMSFSSLVYGDKGDAGNQDLKHENAKFASFLKKYPDKINEFVDKFISKKELDNVRTEIRNEIAGNLINRLNKNKEQRCFLLTCPTGSGKTAILLYLASIMLNKLNVNKIIYSIPFLSITEQVYDIIDKIFTHDDCVKRIDSKAMPEEDYDFEDYEQKDQLQQIINKIKKILKIKSLEDKHIEQILKNDYLENSFDFPFIVTTFVQFFQSFTTASNKGLMKFSNLKNCIFVIDELQSLNPNQYTFFAAIVDEFCKRFNSYAIFSTATMPFLAISKEDKKSVEMFKNYEIPCELSNYEYFKYEVFNRYKLKILGKFTVKTITQEIIACNKSTLIIVNTIKDSRDIFEILMNQYDNVYLINGDFHANHRRKILKEVKDKLLNKSLKTILITTQVIEAGVDIDFPVVFRDVAPLPHIIQAGGRCNREGNPDKGELYLFKLIEINAKGKECLRADYIYKGHEKYFLEFTLEELSKKLEYEEKELFEVQQSFFKYVSNNLKFGNFENEDDLFKDFNFVDLINEFKFGDIGKFKVISKNKFGKQIQFYVPQDQNDNKYEVLLELIAEQNIFDEQQRNKHEDKIRKILTLKTEIKLHIKSMMDFVVQATLTDDQNPFDYSDIGYASHVCGMYKLRPEYYSERFGLSIRR